MKGKYMWTTKMGEKGQIVIPKEARDVFNLKKGDTIVLFGDVNKGIGIVKQEDCINIVNKILNSTHGGSNDKN